MLHQSALQKTVQKSSFGKWRCRRQGTSGEEVSLESQRMAQVPFPRHSLLLRHACSQKNHDLSHVELVNPLYLYSYPQKRLKPSLIRIKPKIELARRIAWIFQGCWEVSWSLYYSCLRFSYFTLKSAIAISMAVNTELCYNRIFKT